MKRRFKKLSRPMITPSGEETPPKEEEKASRTLTLEGIRREGALLDSSYKYFPSKYIYRLDQSTIARPTVASTDIGGLKISTVVSSAIPSDTFYFVNTDSIAPNAGYSVEFTSAVKSAYQSTPTTQPKKAA